jgi:hypothetical protein
MSAFIDMTGYRFGSLQVVERSGYRHTPGGQRQIVWRCRCECGNEIKRPGCWLRHGSYASCGCKRGELVTARKTKHGHAKKGSYSKTYMIWESMRARCANANNKRYLRYGGRGISVCDRWNDFSLFLEDMGEAPKGLSIERIDNNLGYSPQNCKWASHADQCRNKTVNVFVVVDGIKICISDACRVFRVHFSSIHRKMKKESLDYQEAFDYFRNLQNTRSKHLNVEIV